MKCLWTIFVLLGFVSISVFGLILMPFDGSHHDRSCLASVINNSVSPCPQADPLGFVNFHSNALKKISSLTLVDDVAIFYAIVLLVTLLLGSAFLLLADKFLIELRKFYNSILPVTGHQLLVTRSWFSLHENSPSFSWGR